MKFKVRIIQGSDVSNADVTIRMFDGPEEGQLQFAGTLHLLRHEWHLLRLTLVTGAEMDGSGIELFIEEEQS